MSNEVSRRFASHKTQTILRAKVVVVGSAAVGKTTLLRTFNNDASNSDLRHYKMTARTDVVVGRRLSVNEHVQVEFHFYDCGGSTIFNFKQEASQYWEDPEFVVVVYDVSDKESFRNVEACHRDVCATCGTRSLPGLLVANKTDLSVSYVSTQARATPTALKERENSQ